MPVNNVCQCRSIIHLFFTITQAGIMNGKMSTMWRPVLLHLTPSLIPCPHKRLSQIQLKFLNLFLFQLTVSWSLDSPSHKYLTPTQTRRQVYDTHPCTHFWRLCNMLSWLENLFLPTGNVEDKPKQWFSKKRPEEAEPQKQNCCTQDNIRFYFY